MDGFQIPGGIAASGMESDHLDAVIVLSAWGVGPRPLPRTRISLLSAGPETYHEQNRCNEKGMRFQECNLQVEDPSLMLPARRSGRDPPLYGLEKAVGCKKSSRIMHGLCQFFLCGSKSYFDFCFLRFQFTHSSHRSFNGCPWQPRLHGLDVSKVFAYDSLFDALKDADSVFAVLSIRASWA